MPKSTRRKFLVTSSSALVGTGLSASMIPNVHVGGHDEIRVALIGCGGRGTGAVAQIFNTAGATKLVAVADAFRHKAEGAVASLRQHGGPKVEVNAASDQFGGGFREHRSAPRPAPGRGEWERWE